MNDRDKLVELIRHEVVPYFAERIADHLIANGVTLAKDTSVPDKWISVTERLPIDKFEEVLVVYISPYSGNREVTIANYDGERWYYGRYDRLYEVTHWMPLPEPPKEGDYD